MGAAVKARIESVLGSARVVYLNGVPDDHPATYVLVSCPVGETASLNLGDISDVRAPMVTVKSCSRAPDGQQAAIECMQAQSRIVDALTGWAPVVGRMSWGLEHVASLPPVRDDSLPTEVVFMAADRWRAQYQL